jgi:D-alanyl-D-alanine endopeptidase (penicillin-binding protein 7)
MERGMSARQLVGALRALTLVPALVVGLAFATGPLPAGAASAAKPRPAATKPAPKKVAKPSATTGKFAKKQAKAPARTQLAKAAPPARPSHGQVFGLHATPDPLDLKSSVALVVDQDTDEVLFSKNPQAVLPIASITKLMTALVVTEAGLPLDEVLTVSQDDVDTEKGSRSRLQVGVQLTRGEMLHLALMSSENRAANALGRHYPGGLGAFVAAMNRKALELGMFDTRYVEPTGLSSRNQSSAHDLALLVKAAYRYDLIRALSTSPEHEVAVGSRALQFRNSNGLVYSPEWAIGLQKTGYIAEAGRCVVMQAELAGRKLIMVLLDSAGRYSRIADAERLRQWLTGATGGVPVARPAS